MEEKLKLSDYLLICTKFDEEDANPAELSKQLDMFLSKIIVKEYIPLKQKEIIMVEILNMLNKDYDAPGAAAYLEVGKIVCGLLSYCVNLDVDVSFITMGYFLVDAIYKFGLYKTITEKCSEDSQRLFKMVDDTINASNIYRIVETASLFNEESYDQWIKSMEKLQDTLDSKTLQDLIDVVHLEAQNTGDSISEQLGRAALEAVQRDMKNEADKFKKAVETQQGEQSKTDIN